MDNVKIVTSRRMHFAGQDVPAGSELAVPAITALDVVNSARGRLVDPADAARLRRWATAQGSRTSFTNAY